MKLEQTLFQKSHLYFIGFSLLVLTAFWYTYFTKLFEQENYRMHTHGVSLILWCLLLISQAWLIRTKHYAWHKRLGAFSYVLVPVVVFTTADLLHYRLQGSPVLGTMDYYFVALVLNALAAFLVFYGLALYHKKKPTIHARYMVCTILPMVTPATDRIIYIFFPSLLPHLPTIEGQPIAPVVGFILTDLLVLGFCVWDWRTHRRWNVFPVALAVLLLYHYSVLNFYRFEFWAGVSRWFVEL